MRTKVTLVLLFLNVALFFFIFQFERRWRTEDNWKEARRRVLGAEAADLRSLEITTGNRTLALTRRGDTWFFVRPIEWPANPNAISRIVNELQFLEHETSFSVADLARNGQSLADYGLDQPRLTVTFTSGEPGSEAVGRPTQLRLGDVTKDGLRLYLLSPDGERIHVVSQSLARSLSLTFDELHADTIFTIPVFEARSLNLQTAAPASLRIRLRRDGSRWSFETPIIARASKNATELAINGLNALRVRSFVTQDAPATLPTEKPSLRISLEGNNRRETLILGDRVASGSGADPEYYAQLDGRSALFTIAIPATLKSSLDRAQEALREARILELDPTRVSSINLVSPNEAPLTLQRLEATNTAGAPAWQIVLRGDGAQGPQTLPADAVAVARLLTQLSLLSAARFQSDAPRDADLEAWGFNRPEREITLTTLNGSPVTLQIGLPTPRDGFAYARLAGNSASVYAIDPEIIRETPTDPAAWRQRVLRDLPAGARITALKLTDLSDGVVLLNTQLSADGEPETTSVPAGEIAALLPHLRTLRAREFVRDQFVDQVMFAGAERRWRYRLDATITLTGGAGEQVSTSELFLSPRLSGDQQLAASREFNAVFLIEQPLLDQLWKIIEGPRDPGPASESP